MANFGVWWGGFSLWTLFTPIRANFYHNDDGYVDVPVVKRRVFNAFVASGGFF